MQQWLKGLAFAAAVLLLGGWLLTNGSQPPPAQRALQSFTQSTLAFVRTGDVAVYRPPLVSSVAIILSGDSGWGGVSDRVAQRLAGEGVLVLGVDTRAYLAIVAKSKGPCHSSAADFQTLAQLAEQKQGLDRYHEPVVIGYSAGASLAFLAAEEAPAAFRGAISLTFPPDVLGPARPFCTWKAAPPQAIAGGFLYRPVPLAIPFTIVQGDADTVVPATLAKKFAAQIPGARFISVAGAGHGLGDWRDWWQAFADDYERMAGVGATTDATKVDASLADLPLIEVAGTAPHPTRFAIFLSGDGGWADLDRSVAAKLAAKGLPVVGWSSLKYFWTEKPPATAAADLARVIRAYSDKWAADQVVLIGYSFGADTLPFMIAGLPPAERAKVAGLVSIAGSTTAEFKFSTLDWFTDQQSGPPVAPALLALAPLPVLCIYGNDDRGALCPTLPSGSVRDLALPGDHHIGGNFDAVIAPILALAPAVRPAG